MALGLAGRLLGRPALECAAWAWAGLGLLLFLNSLLGLCLVYGPPAKNYMRALVRLGAVKGPVVVADLHIGTYRYAYALMELLPEARVHSIDCWDESGPSPEENLEVLRTLEAPPAPRGRLEVSRVQGMAVPLADASCDVVVMGLGIHEIEGERRDALFAQARRLLKPGGAILLFEHTVDLQSLLVFGPEIKHWAKREEWLARLRSGFTDVRHARHPQAVDLFAATRA